MKQSQNGMWLPDGDTFFQNKGEYELRDYNIAKEYFSNGSQLALDVGAHCGYWSKRLVNDFEQVIAFEPIKEHYDCLVKNTEQVTNFTAINNAVSDTSKVLYMQQAIENSGMTQVVNTPTNLKVTAIPLDAVIDKNAHVDFIKIDVEGHEAEVLRGARQLLERCHPVIFVEILDNNTPNAIQVRELLTLLSYKLDKSVEKNQIWVWTGVQATTFLHIPKTGGTAIKNAQKKDPGISGIIMANSHTFTLKRMGNNTALIVRDPWKRFCSGFWERKTNSLRQALNEQASPQFRERIVPVYLTLTQLEQEILSQCDNPDDLVTYIRKNPQVAEQFQLANHKTFPLGVVLAPLTDWLGTLPEYKTLEHKVKFACSTGNLSKTMKSHFDIDMPTDPFLARSRDQFGIEQSYQASDQNIHFFKQFRKDDIDLVNYIITRDYYAG
jgi:FkbM family methyltransferase